MLETEICFIKFGLYLHFGGAGGGMQWGEFHCSALQRPAVIYCFWRRCSESRLGIVPFDSVTVIEYHVTSEHCYPSTALRVFSLVLSACTNWRDISRTLKYLNFVLSLRFLIWTMIVFLVYAIKMEFVLYEVDTESLRTV